MKTKRDIRYQIKSEINIVPFLDILLILLVIFMMMPSKLLIQQSFEVHLPNSNVTKNFIKNNNFLVTIEILGTELYNLIINNKKITHICSDELMSNISSIVSLNPNLTCLIAASKEEKYNEIIKILNKLHTLGINSVGMVTNPTNIKYSSTQ